MENLKLVNTQALLGIPNMYERAKYNPSNEEFGVFISQIASFFTSQLKAISETFVNSINRLMGMNDQQLTRSGKELFDMRQSIDKIKQNVKLVDVEKIQVPVLLGMKLSLPDSLDRVSRGFDIIDKELIAILKETDDTVSKVLTNKDFRTQTKPFRDKNDFEISSKLYGLIAEIIDENGVKDRANLGNVIPSINSYDTCYDTIIKLNGTATLKRMEEIKTLSKVISERVNTLYKYLNDNKDMNISRNVLEHLGGMLENSAKAITSAITMIYVYNQCLDTFKHSITLVEKLADK
jgi:hypothetical protein